MEELLEWTSMLSTLATSEVFMLFTEVMAQLTDKPYSVPSTHQDRWIDKSGSTVTWSFASVTYPCVSEARNE